MNEIEQVLAQATTLQKKIVLPESTDVRVVTAAAQVAAQGLAEIILLGDAEQIAAIAESVETATHKGINLGNCQIINPQHNSQAEKYAEVLLRSKQFKHSPITHAQAMQQIRVPLTLAMCMVACGDADGCVAGAATATSEVVRAALQIVGVKKVAGDSQSGLVSSFFIMQHDLPHQAIRGTAVFADCALVIDPDAAQLACIAMDTSASAIALLNLTPRVALLSFSTAGSANHPHVDKVREAGQIIAQQCPEIALLAEVQFDAAVIPEILRRKAPSIQAEAPANIFIFPDLQSANIGYKIAERIGAARAVGPILQGLNRPVNDLSRGCCVEDIVKLVAVTAVQSHSRC